MCSTACCPSASSGNVFPAPDGPHTTRFSRRWTHSRVRSACWVGVGLEDASGLPGLERPRGREPRRGPPGRECGTLAAGDPLGEQGVEDLGRFPALGLRGRHDLGGVAADVGQPQPAQQVLQLGGQRRCTRRDHHAVTPSSSAGTSLLPDGLVGGRRATLRHPYREAVDQDRGVRLLATARQAGRARPRPVPAPAEAHRDHHGPRRGRPARHRAAHARPRLPPTTGVYTRARQSVLYSPTEAIFSAYEQAEEQA